MFEELKTFIAVVDYKNFTKAAQALNLSQPSVSSHIKHLEMHFGTILINRSVKQKNITITESGYRLYQHAKGIMNLLEIAYLEVPEQSGTIKGTLKVGASLTIGEYIIPSFLAYFSKHYPDIDVELTISNTTAITNQIKSLTLDIGLVEGTVSSSELLQEYFFQDRLVLAMPYDNFSENIKYSPALIEDKKWIVREAGSGTREYLDMFLNLHEIVPKKVMVLGSNYAVKEAVRNNLGITIISDLVARPASLEKELSIFYLDEPFIRHFSWILPKSIAPTKATHLFIEELMDYTKTLKSFYSNI